jgi:hypothetical protein
MDHGPHDGQPENNDLAERRLDWPRLEPGCSAPSCIKKLYLVPNFFLAIAQHQSPL